MANLEVDLATPKPTGGYAIFRKRALRAAIVLTRRRRLSAARVNRLEKQLKDYVTGGMALFWQRQVTYLGSAMLAGYFYSVPVALFCLLLCEVAEALDYCISRKVMLWQGGDSDTALNLYLQLLLSSIFSAIAVSTFALLVAKMEGHKAHFTPLFFLFAAGLFAAVNNHQLPKILAVRLAIYCVSFLYIPLSDIWEANPPLRSDMWLQFFTVIFVLYFVADCSLIFLRLYRKGLDQLDELRRERDRAKSAYEVKSQFVSIVSHELRTPLTSIMGALGLLQSGAFDDAPERAAKVQEIAYKNSKRLADLINDLLDLQKLESGQMTYDFADTNLVDVVTEAVESISGFAETEGITISVNASDDSLMIWADHDRMLQVMANLLSNAVKFSNGADKVVIDLTETDGKARVTVTDFGIGIPENSRDVVFSRFSQVDSSDHRAFDGTGLGMSITEQIVIAHNGVIDYDSAPGQGSTFFVELDLA